MAELTDVAIDAQLDVHLARYCKELAAPHADLVEFDKTQRLMFLHLSNRRRVVFPLEDIQGLADASLEQLERFEMLGTGQGLDWPELNVSYSVSGLLEGLYGNQLWMQQLRQKGGASKSEAKQKAARANGAKGGRPRKSA